MKHHLKRTITFIIGWPLSIISLFFIARLLISKSNDVLSTAHTPNFVLLAIAGISFFLYFLLRGYFWHRLLRLEDIRLPFKDTLFFWSLSELRRYIPGNIWSLISRTSYFGKTASKKTILKLQIQEAAYIVVAGGFLSLLTINFLFFGVFPFLPYPHILIPTLVTLGCFFTGVFLTFPYWRRFLPQHTTSVVSHFFPQWSVNENVKLMVVMLCSWLWFGLGTYLAIDSFVSLYLPDVLPLMAFFVFSFLAGYLSFITPMGLGVREGVMGLGVARYVNSLVLGVAGAVVARVVLVVTELVFITFSAIWYKTSLPMIDAFWRFLIKHKYTCILTFAIVVYVLYFSAASFLRYTNFYTGRFDLGNMDQTVWNTIHGHIFQLTDPDGTAIVSRLAYHADFILVLLSPFYVLWQDPRMLLLIQTLTIAGGALFVYLLGKAITKNKLLSLLFAISYLLNPSVEYSNLYDFHAVVLATTFLLGSWYFLLKKRFLLFGLCALLAGLTKEEMWIIVGLLGIFFGIKEKKWVWGSIFGIVSFGIFYYLVSKAIPLARGKEHFALSYYADFGSSPIGILKNIFLSPQKIIATVFQPSQLFYLGELFLPLGFLSVLSPLVLIFSGPELGINLLSKNTQLHEIYFQYTAAITPFLFISALYSAKWIQSKWRQFSYAHVGYFVLSCTLLSAYFFGPLVGSMHPNIDMFDKPLADKTIIQNFLQQIPTNLSVAATNNLGSHLSHRQKIFTIPVGINEADIIVFLLNDIYAQPSLESQKQMVEEMKHNKNYIEVFKLDDFVVFEKRNLYLHKEPNEGAKALYPLSITALQKRDFVGGQITRERVLETTSRATTYLISYPSDGLKVYAAASVPKNPLPSNGFPVIILNRGFIPTNTYSVASSYKAINDYFASKGFLVIRPEYRGNGQSESDLNLPKNLGYPVDVLNLLTSLSTLPEANAQSVFLWGHSTGAEVTLATLAIHDGNSNMDIPIKAASLWAPITDPYQGYVQLHKLYPSLMLPFSGLVQNVGTPSTNPFFWQSISPLYYIEDITTPIQISHGIADTVIPYTWSLELFNDLKSVNKQVNLYLYEKGDHTLTSSMKKALDKDIAFFNSFIH